MDILIDFAVAALVIIFTALNHHYIIKQYPKSDGAYNYVKSVLRQDHAFICAWFFSLAYILIIPLISLVIPWTVNFFAGDILSAGFHYTIGSSEVYLGQIIASAVIAIILYLLFAFVKGIHKHIKSLSLYAMIKDKLFPEWFNKLGKNHLPENIMLCTLFIAIISSFFGEKALGCIVDTALFGASIGCAYTSISAYKIAQNKKNPSKMALGIAGLVIAICAAVSLLMPINYGPLTFDGEFFIIIAIWSVLGFMFYWNAFQDNPVKFHSANPLSIGVILLLLITYSLGAWLVLTVRWALNRDTVSVMTVLIICTVIVMLLIIVALSSLVKVYRSLQIQNEKLEIENVRAEEKSEYKSEFLSNMSHSIRTPMNAIVGFTNLAIENKGDEDKVFTYLNKIKGSSDHLVELVNDILEMNLIESGRIEIVEEKCNLTALIDEVRGIMENQALEKGIALSSDLSEVKNADIYCDPLRFKQIMLNLLSNSIEYTPNGGRVDIRIIQEESLIEEHAIYSISVKDSGVGMSPEFLKRVFEPFERADKDSEGEIRGTGLGMAITKNLVEMLGGSITVSSKENEGTEFNIIINFHIQGVGIFAQQKKLAKEKAEYEKNMDFSGKRVLLVDDISINREIAKRLLESRGLIVEEAADGVEALEKIQNPSIGTIDIVLMDIMMPVMNGYDATIAIRKLPNPYFKNVPIIATTANAFDTDKQKAMSVGMNGHISKPINLEELMKTMYENIT